MNLTLLQQYAIYGFAGVGVIYLIHRLLDRMRARHAAAAEVAKILNAEGIDYLDDVFQLFSTNQFPQALGKIRDFARAMKKPGVREAEFVALAKFQVAKRFGNKEFHDWIAGVLAGTTPPTAPNPAEN